MRSAELAQTRLADFPAGQMAASDIAHTVKTVCSQHQIRRTTSVIGEAEVR